MNAHIMYTINHIKQSVHNTYLQHSNTLTRRYRLRWRAGSELVTDCYLSLLPSVSKMNLYKTYDHRNILTNENIKRVPI